MRVCFVAHTPQMATWIERTVNRSDEKYVPYITSFGSAMMGHQFDLIVIQEGWFKHFSRRDLNEPPASAVYLDNATAWLRNLQCRLAPWGRIIEANLTEPLSHSAPRHEVPSHLVHSDSVTELPRGVRSIEWNDHTYNFNAKNGVSITVLFDNGKMLRNAAGWPASSDPLNNARQREAAKMKLMQWLQGKVAAESPEGEINP